MDTEYSKDQGIAEEAKHGEQTIELSQLHGSQSIHPTLTKASEQQPDLKPDIQIRAIIVTIVAALQWVQLLYTITVFAAFNRNIVAVLGDTGNQSWIPNALNIVAVVMAPILSHFSDTLGDKISRKWFLIVPCLFATIGSIIASRAQSTNVVIIGSALVGVGVSNVGIAAAIPSEVLPHKWRPIGQALVFTLANGAGFASLLGPASAITRDPVNGWRWLFYSSIIGWVVTAILWAVFYNPPLRTTELTERRPSVDWIGYTLLTFGSVFFVMGLTWGGVTYPWRSGHVLGTFIPGIALYIALGLWEWKGRNDGIFHHKLFADINFALVLVAILIEGFVYLGFVNLYPGETATVYQPNLFKAIERSLPFYGTFPVFLLLGGWYATKTRDFITPTIIGYALFLGATIGLSQAKPGHSALPIAMNALAGAGFSQPLTFLTIVAQFAAPPSLIATSTAIVLSIRSLGGAIGIAVVNTIVNSRVDKKLPAYIAAATLPLGLKPAMLPTVIGAASGSVPLITAIEEGKIPGVTPRILAAAHVAAAKAFADSYKPAWIVIAALSGVGLLSIFFLRRRREQLDYVIDAPLEHVHHKNFHA